MQSAPEEIKKEYYSSIARTAAQRAETELKKVELESKKVELKLIRVEIELKIAEAERERLSVENKNASGHDQSVVSVESFATPPSSSQEQE
mmetsp:Transcript_36605/g.62323  ORF Transcript_36605/g.62323 Transcript_36605/m.62323 type:complete len:91 (+) Transcript_36605:125-397(+)